MALLQWLDQQPATHFVFDRLGGRRVADAILGVVPLERRLAGSRVRYRHRFVDTFMVADEIFQKQVYGLDALRNVRTFADLGCNVGLFVAWLAHCTGRRDLRGIAVDANPRLVRETRWVAESNHLAGVRAVSGLVGRAGGAAKQEFFVSDVSLRSTRFPEPGMKGYRISVPTVDIEETWRTLLGDVPCDLLKMDIEGAEADFLTPDNPFLARVREVVLEWHGWVISQQEVDARLTSLSFEKVKDLALGEETGVALYRKRAA